MLKHSFIHIPRIGKLTESKIWQSGIRTWEEAQEISSYKSFGIPELLLQSYLDDSFKALENRDFAFFNKLLPTSETWRLYPQFSYTSNLRVAYLDIETDGSNIGLDSITVIGVFDGINVKQYIQGYNLRDFADDIEEYDLLVTFNGKLFDIPVIESAFYKIRLPKAHIDLRFVLRQVNLKGGLKYIERQTNLAREQDELGQLDGYDAVFLWRLHKQGDSRALPTLLRYNAEDIVGLKPLLELACNRLVQNLPLDLPFLPISNRIIPNINYYPELIEKLKLWRQSFV
jgi:uncharacterized protein YprB with RNaseH-like and TPR domain